jgi:S-adenosylmethionine decarboxylase
MFFEGAEKKFELVVRGGGLRQQKAEFWPTVVDLAGAKILSTMSNADCDAYLLSESSLFVTDERVTMITCGRTSLAKAAMHLLQTLGLENVEFFTYERKNEYYPHQQLTDFFKDVQRFNAVTPGKAFRFGAPDEHHLFLYNLDKPYAVTPRDSTLEILMYNLQGPASEIFNSNQTVERVRQLTALKGIFPDFQIDDHLFEPCGYSLNAIRGSDYYTIHVTPEDFGSYVSFETNAWLGDQITNVIQSVVGVFQPASFDVVYFHPEKHLQAFELQPFVRRKYVRQTLDCGFEVGFATYYLNFNEALPAVALTEEQ